MNEELINKVVMFQCEGSIVFGRIMEETETAYVMDTPMKLVMEAGVLMGLMPKGSQKLISIKKSFVMTEPIPAISDMEQKYLEMTTGLTMPAQNNKLVTLQ